MGCFTFKCCFIITPIILVGISYWLYQPLPEGLKEKWTAHRIQAIMKLLNFYVKVKHVLGYGTKVEILRAFQQSLMSGTPQEDNFTITEEYIGKIPVMIFRPHSVPSKSPAIVYFHGGGWALCSSAIMAGGIADIAKWMNVVVISIDYRLSPEHPFPAAFDDCVTATVHVLQNGDKYGIDSSNVGVAGDSSGGNLAAAVALRLANEQPNRLPKLKCQILIYPALQALDLRLPSYVSNDVFESFPRIDFIGYILYYLGMEDTEENIEILSTNNHVTPGLKKSEFVKFIDQNLLPPNARRTIPTIPESDNKTFAKRLEPLLINPYIFPLMAKDLSKVPPAFIVTCQFDMLSDEGRMYAERLRRSGVDVIARHIEGYGHGFFTRFSKSYSRSGAMVETLEQLERNRHKYFQ
ncbi:hypothetical protein LOTGIDRAFT_172473 [Lottia gigantea]|uniref:Alpha/beta hydrolase fold-3 domain-containing protein n=1 Tax=Lottia gigantea TaxID=225164 RepID=V4B250_LOTGI|nr:hypothetical protein LOTGIDRAFT_172473 [Lottia gigantea]ESP01716.1 hypothetical protein LOTGIDRAFT_172473 [Lottia gigantea]